MAVQATSLSYGDHTVHPSSTNSRSSHNNSSPHCLPCSFSKRPARPAFKKEKSASSKAKRVSIEDPEVTAREYDDMAASFPQFCTMCENQLIFPSSTILYCSEGCRRRDMNKPLSSSVPSSHHLHSRPKTPSQSFQSFDTLSPPRDIIPQRSPTTITANRFSFTDLSSAAGSDIDDDGELFPDDQSRHRHHRRQESEAARYLQQFQPILESSARQMRRPKPQSRSSTISLAPSLTHSPSPGTSPSSATTLASLPLTVNSRPLPSRFNPYSSSFAAKSISLVTPSAGAHSLPQSKSTISLPGLKSRPSVATDSIHAVADELPNGVASEELKYEKKAMLGSVLKDSQSQLRSLFRFDEMQAPPSSTIST